MLGVIRNAERLANGYDIVMHQTQQLLGEVIRETFSSPQIGVSLRSELLTECIDVARSLVRSGRLPDRAMLQDIVNQMVTKYRKLQA